MEGLSLAGPAEAGPAPLGSTRLPSPELAANVLAAAGGTVQSMRIGELDDGLLFGTLTISGPAGENEVQAGLGDALGLARQQHCPILAGDDVLARHGVTVPPGEPVEDLLIRQAGLPLPGAG
jgi:bifunctional DNase/RNase